MRRSALVTAVRLLPIVVLLAVLACGESSDDPTPVPAAASSGGGDQTGAQVESAKQLDQPTPIGAAALDSEQTQAVSPSTPGPPTATGPPSRSLVPPHAQAMPMQVLYRTAKNLDNAPDGSSDVLAKLVAHSTLIVIGTTSDAEPRQERVPGRLPSDPSKPDPNFTMIGNVYEVHVERYMKGSGDAILSVIQSIGYEAIVPGPGNTPGRLTQGRDTTPNLLLGKSSRYLLFLSEQGDDAPGLWMGAVHPYKFLMSGGRAKAESPVGTLDGAFPDRTEAEFVSLVESLITGNIAVEIPKMAAFGIPDGVRWVLESVDGKPTIEGTFASLTIRGDGYGGFDGCNSIGGRNEDGTPVAAADGTFSAPGATQTLMLCEGPDGIMEQADAFTGALIHGERFRVEGDRLEIIDGVGEVRLVLVRQAPLPGRPADMVGTAWQLLVEDDEGSGVRIPTLAFLNDRIAAGMTACRGYVADYSVSDGRVRFPALGMTGSTESCTNDLLWDEGEYTTHLSWTDDYSVDESTGERLLRIRTRQGNTLVFEPLPSAVDSIFVGRWSLTTFVETKDQSRGGMRYSRKTDVVPGTEVTIEFSETGVSGSAGCNSYNAPVEVENGMITVGAASVTRAWCDDPDRLMDQERRYLEVLSRVTEYRIYGDRLSLHKDDDMALLFQAE